MCVYVPSKREQKSHLQLSDLQCCHFDIVILRVAITSNVQNVRLQSRHRPTDNDSTRRWRGSQQTGPANYDTFITSLATLYLSNKQINVGQCPVLYIFSGLGRAKIIEIKIIDLTELQSNVLRFMNHGKNVDFDFCR